MIRVPFTTPEQVDAAMDRVLPHLNNGGLIAYPTETVYGFGGLIEDDALTSLAALKSRDEAKPFLLLVTSLDQVPELQWSDSARKLAGTFWPGPLTIALPVRGELSARILSTDGNVAIRATPHEGLRSLIGALRAPITSTSANLPGKPPAADASEVENVLLELQGDDVMILDGGRLSPSKPSTVVDCSVEPPRVLRAGAITLETLSQVVHGIAGNDV
jgi:L-threonylcarbamoyladenylate synthase